MNRALLSALAIMIVFSWRDRETIAQDNPPPQNWNQALTDVAKSVNSTTWHAANYTPTITSTFAGAPNARYDVITVTRPPNATNMGWKAAGVFRNPRDDGALIRPVVDNPIAPPAYPTPPAGACVGRVEGRQSIGAQYWVEVSVSLRPARAQRPPAAPATPWWGVEIGTPGAAAGSLILTDINGGVSISDASPNTLGCDVAADDSLGDVRFTLDANAGTFTWTITPEIQGQASTGQWQQAPYAKTLNNIPTGSYTLTVNGPNVQKQITFAVIHITLTAPTQNQEFAIDVAAANGPTMPQVQLTATVTPQMANLTYSFEVGNPTTGRALEYEDAPATGYAHPPIIISPWVDTNSWNIAFGNNVYGGRVTTVKVCIRQTNLLFWKTFARTFYIIGGALPDATRNAYINNLVAYDNTIRLMTRTIALKESGGSHYWNGGGIGTAARRWYPMRQRGGTGVGVMQLTSAHLIDRDTIWNWQRNIDRGMVEIQAGYNRGVAYLNDHPNNVTDVMRRFEGYSRYNGGPGNRYHWWSNGPATNGGVAAGWTKFGYIIPTPDRGLVYRDFNNDGRADRANNPYNIPRGPTGQNALYRSAERYADEAMQLEQ